MSSLMRFHARFLGPALVLWLALAPAARVAGAQQVDLDEFEAASLDQLTPEHREWLQQEVVWIITDLEREVFLRLPNAEQRDGFIAAFWRHRDPTPGTPRNEYRELHERRLQIADRQFGRETGRRGALTDRGRMVVLLGEPQSVSRFPASPVAVPVQVWTYSVDPILGLPPFFNLVFFRERGVGVYRLYSPLADGPESLLNPAGQNEATTNTAHSLSGRTTRATTFGDLGGVLDVLSTVDTELAQVSLSLIPGDPSSMGIAPLRSETLLADMELVPSRIMPEPEWALRMLVGAVESDVRFATLPADMVAAVLVDPAGVPYLHYAVRVPGKRINLGEYEGSYYATYDVSAGIRDTDLRFLHTPDPGTVQLDLDAEQSRRLRTSDIVHMGRIPVVAGSYDFDLTLENNVTHEFATRSAHIRVPRLPVPAVSSSVPFLATEHEALGADYDPYGPQYPFQVGSHFVMPGAGAALRPQDTLWVFHQLFVPSGDAGKAVASYQVLDTGGTVRVAKESTLDLRRADRFGILSQLAGLSIADLDPGQYTVRVDVDRDDQAAVELPVRIVAAADYVAPIPHAPSLPPATDSGEMLARVRQERTLGRLPEAIALLHRVIEREPDNDEALGLLRETLSDAGDLEELADLLSGRLTESPNDIDMLLQLAEVKARQEDNYDAIRYYERARLAGAPDAPELLNPLAAAYLAEGRGGKARELLQRSLELDPEQPGAAAMLEKIGDGL